MTRKVLILSASTGGGHNRAARAVQEEAEKLGLECKIVDSLKFVSKMVDTVISKGYETSALYTPKAYGGMYRISDTKVMRKGMDKNLLLKFITKRLWKLIQQEQPDYIVGTHPFPVMAVSKLKEYGYTVLPLYSIITDYTIHSAHIAKEVNAYIVADEYMKSLLEKEGVSSEIVYPYGIPIEKRFLEVIDASSTRKEFDLKDKFTLMLMGGSFGAGNIIDVLSDLLKIKEDIQIIIVCGRNSSLYSKVERYLQANNKTKDILLLGFTDKMNALMSVSNCIVTKPGGLTTTECILKELPMIIPFFIPGQEKDNLDFLLNNGLAIRPTGTFPLDVVVKTLYDYPEKLERIKVSMRMEKKEGSAEKIASLFE